MSDVSVVVLAFATAAGAWMARPVPFWVGAVVALVAFATRRPALLWLGAALVASSLSAAAWAGVRPPEPRAVNGVVTLVRDPVEVGGAERATARLGGRHVEITARGGPGRVLAERLAGERVAVSGQLGPVAPVVRAHLAPGETWWG